MLVHSISIIRISFSDISRNSPNLSLVSGSECDSECDAESDSDSWSELHVVCDPILATLPAAKRSFRQEEAASYST